MRRISANCPCTESAASGSSRMYSPRGPKRSSTSERNDSPCDCSCSSRSYTCSMRNPLAEGCEVEEALGAQEERVRRANLGAFDDERLVQFRVGPARRERHHLQPPTALGVQLARDRERL